MPTDPEETRASNASVERHGRDEGYLSITRLVLSAERGAWQEVVFEGEGLRDTIAKESFLFHVSQQVSRRIFPILALAYEHLGRSGEADALAKDVPEDVYDGWRADGLPCYATTTRAPKKPSPRPCVKLLPCPAPTAIGATCWPPRMIRRARSPNTPRRTGAARIFPTPSNSGGTCWRARAS